MANNNGKNGTPKNEGTRFERLTKSVLESDHPVFGKIKKEIPQFYSRQNKKRDWKSSLSDLNKKFNIETKAIIVGMAVVISFFIYRQITDPHLDYAFGKIAERPLIARHTIEVVDKQSTAKKEKEAVAAVRPVFDLDRTVSQLNQSKVEKSFSLMRRKYARLLRRKNVSEQISEVANKEFSAALGITVSAAEFESLRKNRFSRRLEKVFSFLLKSVDDEFIVSDRALLTNVGTNGIAVNQIKAGLDEQKNQVNREFILTSTREVKDLENIKNMLSQNGKRYFPKSLATYRPIVVSLAHKLIVPNLTMNRQETIRRKELAKNEVKPAIIKIEKGEVIIRYRERVSRRHMLILNHLQEANKSENTFFKFIFTVIFISILMYALFSITSGGIQKYQYKQRDIVVFLTLMILEIIAIQFVQFLAIEGGLVDKFPHIPFEFYYFLFPIATAPVVIRMIATKEPALFFSLVSAVVGGILLERNFFYACYILASSLTAASLVKRVKTRGDIYLVGLLTGFVNVAMIICIVANTRNAASIAMLQDDIQWILIAGMVSGILTSALAVAIIPVVEFFSGHTTDLKLLELANMNHPLLRDLMVKAPGTYHHSIVIGSLVEAGAEAIGANPLLARVMAYYHDVGKMERPLYFIENQQGGYNRHDTLQPHMSAMIIREHVKKGQELGRRFKLPDQVIAAMSEHHGSSTITYFYNKARAMAEDPDSVLESDYKYDGRKPQTKETALVMLGDVTEAATRSVADPTPLRLSGIVKNVLNKYFAEGQLSECDLTLRDLDLIAKSFLDVLVGIYHARIEYNVGISNANRKRQNEGTDRGTKSKATKDSPASGSITSITTAVKNSRPGGQGSGKR